jgi:MoaA/NifB/PqqE/SkfB family radical SAM enzyme
MRGSHGWAEIARERKREIIRAIVAGTPTSGPSHIELDLTDRCNVACYFCNQQDLRTKEQLPVRRTTELIDEMAGNGLRSVRLSGGGDPLFHREIGEVLEHLALRGVVLDNLTTNGVAMTPEIARNLVHNKAREVIFSVDAADPADYHRMLRVKPEMFDKVVSNIQMLVAERGDGLHPSIVVQFLLDRENFRRMVDMYDLARSLGVDRISLGAVLDIPRERIDHNLLLTAEDAAAAEPFMEEVLRRDADVGIVQIDFPVPGWNAMIQRVRDRLGVHPTNMLPIASSFRESNGGCFFAWYTAAITGTGDVRPCCLMLSESVKPLGNVNKSSMTEIWHGPEFQLMRAEMREVLLRKGKIDYSPERFQILKEPCVNQGLCWLKNMYFRGDEEFYAELATALDEARRKEVRWIGKPTQMRRRAEIFLHDHPKFRKRNLASYVRSLPAKVRNASRALRFAPKKRSRVEQRGVDSDGFRFVTYPGARELPQITELTKQAHRTIAPGTEPPPTAVYDTDSPLDDVVAFYLETYGYREGVSDAPRNPSAPPRAYRRGGDLNVDLSAIESLLPRLNLQTDLSRAIGSYQAVEISPKSNRPRVTVQRPYFDVTTSEVVDRTFILMAR